jgi:hypothetical protein
MMTEGMTEAKNPDLAGTTLYTSDCRSPSAVPKQAVYKPVFIKKQRRTLSSDMQLESFSTENRLRVPAKQAAEGKPKVKAESLLKAVDFLNCEPHISRLKERLRVSQAKSPSKAPCSLLAMDVLDRSSYWLARRDSGIKARREQQELKLQEQLKFKPQLTRPKSFTKLAPSRPKKRRTLSNSYLEMHQVKQRSSLAFLYSDTVSPTSAYTTPKTPQRVYETPSNSDQLDFKAACGLRCSSSKSHSLNVSFQATPSNLRTNDQNLNRTSVVSHVRAYVPLSPTDYKYSFAGSNKPAFQTKSPTDSLSLDLTFPSNRHTAHLPYSRAKGGKVAVAEGVLGILGQVHRS